MTLLNRRDIILNSLGVTMHEIWDGIGKLTHHLAS